MSDTKTPPSTQRAYTFCTQTREYLGELDAYLSPLEGIYPLPGNAVFVEPGPDPGPYKARRLTADGTAWEIVDDFRYILLWDVATAHPVPNALMLGEAVPSGFTHLVPPDYEPQEYKYSMWDDQLNDWIAAPDYSRCPLWSKATAQRSSPLSRGVTLPETLTTLPPPTGENIKFVWSEITNTWIIDGSQ